MNLHVTVTSEHIAIGSPASYAKCPIALALLSQGIIATVGAECVATINGVYSLPEDAREFTKDYDRGDFYLCDPFSFDLTQLDTIPPELAKQADFLRHKLDCIRGVLL